MQIRLYAGLTVLLAFSVAADVPATTLDELQQRLVRVEKSYNVERAKELVRDLQMYVAEEPSVPARLALGRATLTVAELMRWDYEEGEDTMDPRDRRLLGREIDEFAQLGHDALGAVPDALSEKWRIKADLWATMIRSNYKGNKYGDNMDRAADRALDLDIDNPNALVTAAKKPLFAEPQHGGDVPKALALLTRAIEIKPDHERALAFRGVAYEKLGNMPKAIADWQQAIEVSPQNRLARKKLDEYGVEMN